MRRAKLVSFLLLLAFLVDAILYVVHPLGQNFYIIADCTTAFFSFLAVILGFNAYKSHQFSDI